MLVSRNSQINTVSLGLNAHSVVTRRRHSVDYASSSRLAVHADAGAIQYRFGCHRPLKHQRRQRMRYRMERALKWTMALLSFFVLGTAWAQDVIKVGYLPQVHDAANFAVDRELGKKYKLEYVKFLRYADAEIALARGDIQIA